MMGTALLEFLSSLIFSVGCLMLAKCFFQKSIMIDKKSVAILIFSSILDGITAVWISTWSVFLLGVSFLLVGYCFFRGIVV